MSLFHTVILPSLEKGLVSFRPELTSFLLAEAKIVLPEILSWVNEKHEDYEKKNNKGENYE
jgi:hypothetical protein